MSPQSTSNSNMPVTSRTDQQFNQVRILMIIIGILTIIILAGIIFYVYKKSKIVPDPARSVPFIQAVPDGTADAGIDNYKEVVKYTTVSDSKGVLFSEQEIRDYLDTDYPAIIARHMAHMGGGPLPANHEWRIGFYWTVRNDAAVPANKRLAFYVVPVLYNTATNTVLDYFKVTYNNFYNHPANDLAPKNVYDEGHLWP